MPQDEPMDLGATLRELDRLKNEIPEHSQRRFARFPARGQALLWPGENVIGVEPLATLHIRDISRGGIGLLSSAPAEPGQLWRLHLGDDRVVMASLPAVCRFCRRISAQAYLVGAEFGIEASVLLAVGVPANAIALGDEPEGNRSVSGDFIDPALLVQDESG